MLQLEGKLTPEAGAALLAALAAAEEPDPDTSRSGRRARALSALISEQKPGAAEVVVHVDAGTLGAERVAFPAARTLGTCRPTTSNTGLMAAGPRSAT